MTKRIAQEVEILDTTGLESPARIIVRSTINDFRHEFPTLASAKRYLIEAGFEYRVKTGCWVLWAGGAA